MLDIVPGGDSKVLGAGLDRPSRVEADEGVARRFEGLKGLVDQLLLIVL